MRVAMTGAGGTGKSTIADAIMVRFGLKKNPVGARSTAADMGLLNPQGQPDPYLADTRGVRTEFQRRLSAGKIAWEASHDQFVSDRTTLDDLCYSILHDVKNITAARVTAAVEGMKRYTHVVYFPPEAFLASGGDDVRIGGNAKTDIERANARAYHECYNAMLWGLLLRHRPMGLIVMAMGDLEARKAHVFAALGG